MQTERLCADTTPAPGTRPHVTGPNVNGRDVSVGIVHFGAGAFHRAHQAVLTEDAMAATGDTGWGILAVTGRSDRVVRQLRPQDCRYSVLLRGDADRELRLVASIRDIAWPGAESNRIADAVAAPATRLATLTITEKGYPRNTDGDADLDRADLRADAAVIAAELAGRGDAVNDASRTAIGLLTRGLARRYLRGGAPFSVVSCDNLPGNGRITGRLVRSLAASIAAAAHASEHAAGFCRWLETAVTFPATMVDRITPATTEADHALAEGLLGLRDEALVVAEPFIQWVIEDDFAAGRPAWEAAGAVITDDVSAYERVKLRVLNASHSMLAYLGALKGYTSIAQAVGDPDLRATVLRVLDDDILPTLAAPAGLDLHVYRDTVLRRFANPNLADTTRRVGSDGSHKLPIRILAPASERLAAGHLPRGLALVVAAWVTYLADAAARLDAAASVLGNIAMHPGACDTLDDPLASALLDAVGSPTALRHDPERVVARVFALEQIFPADLRAHGAFRAEVVAQLEVVRAIVGRN
jgi:fructuronate reductase